MKTQAQTKALEDKSKLRKNIINFFFKNNKILNWLLASLWMAVIFGFSSMPQIKASQFYIWDFLLKKTAHVFEYAILYILIFRATGKKYVLSFILTIAFALTDEYHQSFTIGRTSTIIDVGIDFSGTNIATYLTWKLDQLRQSKQKKQEKILPKN